MDKKTHLTAIIYRGIFQFCVIYIWWWSANYFGAICNRRVRIPLSSQCALGVDVIMARLRLITSMANYPQYRVKRVFWSCKDQLQVFLLAILLVCQKIITMPFIFSTHPKFLLCQLVPEYCSKIANLANIE